MTIRTRFTAAVESLKAFLTPAADGPDNDPPKIDKRYVWESNQFAAYSYVDVVNRDDEDAVRRDGWYGLRCTLCGRVFELDAAEALFSHIGDHTADGDGEIDPFRTDSETYGMGALNVSQNPSDASRVEIETGVVAGVNTQRAHERVTEQSNAPENVSDGTRQPLGDPGGVGPAITEEELREAKQRAREQGEGGDE
jgi:hypothetical protein